ncbi:hypothetical protein DL769_000766 [Monosporascus sp. CRB-8-3]|nr:hypothetical protein DL769_000766 [Monosporascus sp. CRB-8-3]
MSGYAVASGALFGAFPGLQWGTSLNADQLTSDVTTATCISNTTAPASTGGVHASGAWSTAVSSASDSGPTTVVIQAPFTASASGSALHILPEDAGEPTAATTTADAAESSTRTRTLRIINEVLTPVVTISEDIAAAEPTTLRAASATAVVPSSTTSTDAVAPVGVRDSEDPEHGVWPPRTRDWYCGTVGAGSGTYTGMCVAQTTSVSADDSNTIPMTMPVVSERGINQCVIESVEMPSPQGGSSGSPGTTTTPSTGYNLKPTTTCEAKDVETPPSDSAPTTTSTPRWMLITVPVTTDSATPTPVPGPHTPPTSSEVTGDNDGSEPAEIKTCDIKDVKTPREDSTASTGASTSTVPRQEGTSTSRQLAITDPVITAAPTPADNRIPPKTTPITSDDDGSSGTEETTCDARGVKTAPEDSTTTTAPASSTTAVATGGIS